MRLASKISMFRWSAFQANRFASEVNMACEGVPETGYSSGVVKVPSSAVPSPPAFAAEACVPITSRFRYRRSNGLHRLCHLGLSDSCSRCRPSFACMCGNSRWRARWPPVGVIVAGNGVMHNQVCGRGVFQPGRIGAIGVNAPDSAADDAGARVAVGRVRRPLRGVWFGLLRQHFFHGRSGRAVDEGEGEFLQIGRAHGRAGHKNNRYWA